MGKLLLAIAAALIAIPLHPRAQEPPAGTSVVKWAGGWDSGGRPAGSMEMVVNVKGDKVSGQVRSTGSSGCSREWEKLEGMVEGDKTFAHYDLGGRCGKVDIIYSIDQEGKIMTGSWTSQWPGHGSFRLTKAANAAATGATRVEEPPMGQLPYGKIIRIDDGTCPSGEVKEITGGDLQRSITREVRCVKRPD